MGLLTKVRKDQPISPASTVVSRQQSPRIPPAAQPLSPSDDDFDQLSVSSLQTQLADDTNPHTPASPEDSSISSSYKSAASSQYMNESFHAAPSTNGFLPHIAEKLQTIVAENRLHAFYDQVWVHCLGKTA
eukprot:jgi/Hompol1/2458/HPOL_006027-RA